MKKEEKNDGIDNDEIENEDSTDSSSEENGTDTTQSDEGKNSDEKEKGESDTSLDKHPRWKQREEDWKKRFNEQEERHTQSLSEIRQEMEEKFKATKPEADPEIPSWFGGNLEQYKEYNEHLKSLTGQAKEEALREIEQKKIAEDKAIKEATDYFNKTVELIESDEEVNPDGIKVDRNKLLKFTQDNDLVDSKGRWNYKAAFKMMQSGVKSSNAKELEKKKKLANSFNSDKNGETKPENYATPETFKRDRPW